MKIRNILNGIRRLLVYRIRSNNSEDDNINYKRYLYTRLLIFIDNKMLKKRLPDKNQIKSLLMNNSNYMNKVKSIYPLDFDLYRATTGNVNAIITTDEIDDQRHTAGF